MKPERLLELYDRISEAPDAVSRLRRFVLDLAVRGKLVEQDPEDEPASELLEWIAAEKTRLVRAGVTKKPKPLAPIDPEKLPIDVPAHWAWARLCEIGAMSGGMTPSKTRPDYWNGDLVWLSPKDIKADEVSDSELKITSKGLSETRLELFPAGSLFIVARSGILKRTFPVAINRVPAASNQDLKVLVPFLKGQERYLQIMFRGLTDFLLTELVKTGTTVQSLKYAEFETQPFPIPPLAEQHRIVAKVDELMALCDRLEEQQGTREATRDRLTTATLSRLTAPDSDEQSFRDHARFALDTLPALTARPDQIETLRQTILDLGIRGKLGENIRGHSSRVGAYRKLQNGYAFKSSWFTKRGIRLLRNMNVGHGALNWSNPVHLPETRSSEFDRFGLRNGDIVISLDRPFISTGTKVARVKQSDLPALLLQRVGRFVKVGEGLVDDYLLLWLSSPAFREKINPGRSSGVPHISSKQVEEAEIYVPSEVDQHRIVAKVNELMALCDRLEASLQQADNKRARLLESLLAEALTPAEAALEAA